MELSVSESACFAGFTLPDDGRFVFAVAHGMAVDAVFRDVDRAAVEPPGKRDFPFQDGFPLATPFQFGRFRGPELLRIFYRGGVDAFIIGEAFDARLFAEGARGFDHAVFDEAGFDVLAHEEIDGGNGV